MKYKLVNEEESKQSMENADSSDASSDEQDDYTPLTENEIRLNSMVLDDLFTCVKKEKRKKEGEREREI